MVETLTHELVDKLSHEELDAAVAVHVMGWRTSSPEGEVWWEDIGDSSIYCERKENWNPHTDANDALRVCEYVCKQRLLPMMWRDGDGWTQRFYSKGRDKLVILVEATDGSLSVAICRAALHAVAEMGEIDIEHTTTKGATSDNTLC